MGLIARYVFGVPAAAIGSLIGGPVVGYAVWKGVGFAATGNPLYLIPGAGTLSDGVTAFGDVAGLDGQGNPSDWDIHQNRPMDGQGNPMGRLGNGELPKDGWGRPL
ncbi:hypothetical protein [Sphingobium lactosutens]|uniref:Uncharacterized protein n=1 Tax=Sphingobium lactosutens DS20 TaxID=1331060 RepID=T0IYJ5_9SPHN|nr:hypothetical protein [Sphingobium lactosutens]EQB16950.1 hypothetical protein RLDS_05810 [Sphingobium lactosutens DS20]